jgi:hypothetical protein
MSAQERAKRRAKAHAEAKKSLLAWVRATMPKPHEKKYLPPEEWEMEREKVKAEAEEFEKVINKGMHMVRARDRRK